MENMNYLFQEIMKQARNDALAIKRFGFDFIYLYVGYEELTTQFLSPVFNKRTDEYGGDIHGRLRLTLEVIEEVRKILDDYPDDIVFEPDLQRCIGVDVRYMLFIIEKFGKASHLIQELKIEG